MRKALLIGIDYYLNGNCLNGCVNDAMSMEAALELNHDQSRNFQCVSLLAHNRPDSCQVIDDKLLAKSIDWLFEGEPDIALFYFSGHGSFNGTEGYLCPSNFANAYSGVPMANLIKAASNSRARNKIIILDCCHSGAAGVEYFSRQLSGLPENTVIMAGCSQDGYCAEVEGGGVFTGLFVEAMNGAGSNLLGEVSPGSIYAYIDKSLGAFEQRPVFKANVKSFICLKRNKPLVPMNELRRLVQLFPHPEYEFSLDPSFEEDKTHVPEGADKERDEAHEAVFRILRRYWQNGLIVPVDAEYLYWAAVNSGSCRLTAMGKHYWRLISKGIL